MRWSSVSSGCQVYFVFGQMAHCLHFHFFNDIFKKPLLFLKKIYVRKFILSEEPEPEHQHPQCADWAYHPPLLCPRARTVISGCLD